MSTQTKALALAAAILVLAGCSSVSPAGYYWGSHSQTYYAYIAAPSEATLNAHIAELERIVVQSEERSLKVPPGILAELGFFKSKASADTDAIAYYQREMELYPESSAFLQRVIGEHQ